MVESERLVKFEILGQEYAFYTGATDEELQVILGLVRQLVENGANKVTGTLPVGKVAVLACLNIASRYVKMKQEFEEYRQTSELRLADLSEKIKASLPTESSDDEAI
jgi:cell division protein ZapA (FtsZ GTPase activity inhibitor)